MSRTVFHGGTVVSPPYARRADLVIEAGKVAEIRAPGPARPGETAVDCAGMYVGPGLVDIHTHGGAGHDFVSDRPEEIAAGVAYYLSQGTTSITPSALSVPFDELDCSIRAARKAVKLAQADILGYHVEGIYLDQTFRGGHLDAHVHNPDPREYEPLLAAHADFITEWTLAPELPGSLELIRACRKAGIVVSAGHSQATAEQMDAAIEAGLSHCTHLYCAMGTIRIAPLRESPGEGYAPGVVEIALLRDELTTEVIADGFHLHPDLIRLAFKCKGADRLCLVSDAMKGVGLPDGEYRIGDQDCVVSGGIALIKDRPGVIASSVTPQIGMMRFAHKVVGLGLPDVWTMASLTPARILGVADRKGSLEAGKDADVLVTDTELNVRGVFVRGERKI